MRLKNRVAIITGAGPFRIIVVSFLAVLVVAMNYSVTFCDDGEQAVEFRVIYHF